MVKEVDERLSELLADDAKEKEKIK